MPKRIVIQLDEPVRAKLERQSKNAQPPYLRERAKAILLAADGMPIYEIVNHLHIRVHRNAISEWIRRFLAEGVEGLKIRQGRGRKPAFFPPQNGGGESADNVPAASVSSSVRHPANALASARPQEDSGLASAQK